MTQCRRPAGAAAYAAIRPSSWLLAIIVWSVALRVAAAVYLGNTVEPLPAIYDQVSYHTLAIRVLEGHGFTFGTGWWPMTPANQPTAHWSFLYVLYLAAVYGMGGPNPLLARLVQALAVGVLHPLLTARVATRLFGARVGLVSAGVVTGYAYFVYYAVALVTESFYILAILWSLDLALTLAGASEQPPRRQRRLWLGLGLALAVAVLLRQVLLVVAPIILLWAWWNAGGRSTGVTAWLTARRRATVGAMVAILVIIVAVLPWTVRNYVAFDRFVLLNTNAGFAFYWGNHPIYGTEFVPILPDGMYATLIPAELRALNEGELAQELMRRGLNFVSNDPMRFLRLSASRVKEYVKFWPSRESGRASNYARVLSFGVCLPFFVGGMIIACALPSPRANGTTGRSRSAPWLLIGFALAYGFVHVVSWTLVRYRLPVDAVLMPFAGLAIVQTWRAATTWVGWRRGIRRGE